MKNQVRKKCILLLGLLMILKVSAQNENDCYKNIDLAKTYLLGSEVIIKDEAKAISLLKPCADQGYAEAQYVLGIIYKKGWGVAVNEKEAFKYIKLSAEKKYTKAVCELGVLYKEGIGCKLNFNTAISYFEESHRLGFEKGAYSIGYMYFKGLGSLEQDYKKAIEWFELSSHPMAKHWLGICNYFGYGMPVNKDQAIELWLDNPITNSEVILEHLDVNPNLINIGKVKENSVDVSEFGTSQINQVISEPVVSNTEESKKITTASLLGEWEGKLVELDWSKERINRTFPISIEFKKDNATYDLSYKATINKNSIENYGILLDNNIYLNDSEVQLPRLYQDNREKYTLEYEMLSFNTIEIKEINNIKYLIADVETLVKDWNEQGTPMLMILGNTKGLTDNGEDIDEALISGLLSLKGDNFITTYPNPFQNDLLIQYDLETATSTSVEIYSFDGEFAQTIVSGKNQEAGGHLYHVDTDSYKKGLYVVRVSTNNITHTKLIVKK